MGKIGIFYASTTGATESLAQMIAAKLGVDSSDINDIESTTANPADYDILLFGSSSTGFGDLQYAWEDYLKTLEKTDLSGKTVALFCCGDSYTYADSFCGAMRKIYDAIIDKGCKLVGRTSVDGYSTTDSDAIIDGEFVGLAIDSDNEDNLTPERVNAWVKLLALN